MWEREARPRVLGAGQEGDKLRLLGERDKWESGKIPPVPHISRRQRAPSIVSSGRRSGGPSGSARALRYRSPPTPHRARAPSYRTCVGHAVCAGLSVA